MITEHDTHKAGDLNIEHIDNINIYQGFKKLDEKKYKFVHCDADIYGCK